MNVLPPLPQLLLPIRLKAAAERLQPPRTLRATASTSLAGVDGDSRAREGGRMFAQPSNDLAGNKREKAAPGRVQIEITRRKNVQISSEAHKKKKVR